MRRFIEKHLASVGKLLSARTLLARLPCAALVRTSELKRRLWEHYALLARASCSVLVKQEGTGYCVWQVSGLSV